jgi:hypothetical protein
MTTWHTQAEVDTLMQDRIREQLSREIAAYTGSPHQAKEILRGLAAARMMDMDLRPFEDALADKHRDLGSSAA